MDAWAERRAGVAWGCTVAQIASYAAVFAFRWSDVAWVVIWSAVLAVTVVCILRVRVMVAKLVYFLTLPPVGVVLWTWVQFLNGTATDFSGLLIVNCGLPLLFLSLVGLITTLAAREPFNA